MIFTIILFALKGRILETFVSKGVEDSNLLRWMEWNILAIPIILGVVFVVKGLRLFVLKYNILKKWEERQMNKYLGEDKQDL